jgi:hypothetical protein
MGGAILSKSTHWYCAEYFCPVVHESMRCSIINAETGGRTKRNNSVTPTDEVTKPTVIINTPAMIRRTRLLNMYQAFRALHDTADDRKKGG